MKLMHCPFCGYSDARPTAYDGSAKGAYYHVAVQCMQCYVRGPSDTGDTVAKATEYAVGHWNTRPTLEEETVLRVTFNLTE